MLVRSPNTPVVQEDVTPSHPGGSASHRTAAHGESKGQDGIYECPSAGAGQRGGEAGERPRPGGQGCGPEASPGATCPAGRGPRGEGAAGGAGAVERPERSRAKGGEGPWRRLG